MIIPLDPFDFLAFIRRMPDRTNVEKKLLCLRNFIDSQKDLFEIEYNILEEKNSTRFMAFPGIIRIFNFDKNYFPDNRAKRAFTDGQKQLIMMREVHSKNPEFQLKHLKELVYISMRNEMLLTLEMYLMDKGHYFRKNVSRCVVKAYTLAEDTFSSYREAIRNEILKAHNNKSFDKYAKCIIEKKMTRELGKIEFLDAEIAPLLIKPAIRSTRNYIRQLMLDYESTPLDQLPIDPCFELVKYHFIDELLSRIENRYIPSYWS